MFWKFSEFKVLAYFTFIPLFHRFKTLSWHIRTDNLYDRSVLGCFGRNLKLKKCLHFEESLYEYPARASPNDKFVCCKKSAYISKRRALHIILRIRVIDGPHVPIWQYDSQNRLFWQCFSYFVRFLSKQLAVAVTLQIPELTMKITRYYF